VLRCTFYHYLLAMDSPEQSPTKQRKLPDDLPTSLNDRRTVPDFGGETEVYDAWAGTTTFQFSIRKLLLTFIQDSLNSSPLRFPLAH
jgi:hypothetical protein